MKIVIAIGIVAGASFIWASVNEIAFRHKYIRGRGK